MESRYEPLAKIASGGMATVFVGALRGGGGMRHLVAIKQPHPHLLDDAELREAILAEAEIASSIRHANVVSVREVEEIGGAIHLVLDYVEGASLGQLLVLAAKRDARLPIGVAIRVVLDACAGLEALHDLTDDAGSKLGFVHRDVSPQNVLVGLDGVARITDFGLAKHARTSAPSTTTGTLKGKLGYMAPEYVRGKPIDARADVFAMGVVAWEAIAGRRLFRGENDADTIDRVLRSNIAPPSAHAPEAGAAIDDAITRALARDPADRFPTIRAFAQALAAAAGDRAAPARDVAALVRSYVGEELEQRRRAIREKLATPSAPPPPASEAEPTRDRPAPRRRFTIGALLVVALAAIALSLVRWREPVAIVPTAPSAPSIAPSVAPPTPAAESIASSPPPAIDAGREPSASPPHRRPAPIPKPPPNPYGR